MTKPPKPPFHTLPATQKHRVAVDYERYAKLLDRPDLSEEQKKVFIDCLWNLISDMIVVGFELVSETRGREDKKQNILEGLPANVIGSTIDQPKTEQRQSSAS